MPKLKKIEFNPSNTNAWVWFMYESIERDKGATPPKPHGWHWFWGLYYLQDKMPNFNLDIEQMLNILPDRHWLKIKEQASYVELMNGQTHYREPKDRKQKHESVKSWAESFKIVRTETITKINFSNISFGNFIDFSNFIFPINTYFKNTKFSQDVLFNDAVFFETADFEEAIFQDERSHCKETAKFRNTTFSKIANFRKAIFWGYANFKGAKLAGRAFFQEAKFKCHAPRFYDATFNNEITWAGIELPDFKNALVDYYKEIDDKFELITCTKCTNCAECTECTKCIKRAICFKHVKCEKCEKIIEENRTRRIEENQNSYENTAILLSGQKKFHDQHFFFRYEMGCRRELEKNHLICLMFWLYEILADYGYGIGHAFKAWAGHIFIGFVLITFIASGQGLGTWQVIFCSISTSFANANPFVFFGFKEGALMECYECLHDLSPLGFGTIRGVQTVIGLPILFLLLTTLRVRFRLNN